MLRGLLCSTSLEVTLHASSSILCTVQGQHFETLSICTRANGTTILGKRHCAEKTAARPSTGRSPSGSQKRQLGDEGVLMVSQAAEKQASPKAAKQACNASSWLSPLCTDCSYSETICRAPCLGHAQALREVSLRMLASTFTVCWAWLRVSFAYP